MPLQDDDTGTLAGAPTAPVIVDGREHALDPRIIIVQRIAGSIAVLIVAGVALIAMVISLLSLPVPTPLKLLLPLAWLAASTALGLLALLWPSVSFRHATYRVDPLGLRIRRGVLWHSVITVPRSRVQHTDVAQGPIERAFGLATLVVYTAGTQHAAVPLSGLAHATAVSIRDHLIVAGDSDAV